MLERSMGCKSKDRVLETPLSLTSSTTVLSRSLGHGLLICKTRELGLKTKATWEKLPVPRARDKGESPGPCPGHPQRWGRALGFPGGRRRKEREQPHVQAWDGVSGRSGLGWGESGGARRAKSSGRGQGPCGLDFPSSLFLLAAKVNTPIVPNQQVRPGKRCLGGRQSLADGQDRATGVLGDSTSCPPTAPSRLLGRSGVSCNLDSVPAVRLARTSLGIP